MRKREEFIMKRDRKEGVHQRFKTESYMPKFFNFKNFINIYPSEILFQGVRGITVPLQPPSPAHLST